MKPDLVLLIACTSLIACNNNKTATEPDITKTVHQPEVTSKTETNQTSGDGIAGYWKLALEAYDDNGNKLLDEEEQKKGIKNRYAFRFNSDGSCQIQGTFKGRYEVKTESNIKMLYVYRKKVEGEEDNDPPPDVYRIVSMNKDQLVLLERESNLTFWVFERAD